MAGSPPLRIGFLSAELRNHAGGLLLADVIPAFDRDRFHLVAFSARPDDGGNLRAHYRRVFDEFHDIENLADDELADRIASAGIDILIDEIGATDGSRHEAVKLRPVPIQVGYLGYPGTMGHRAWDYVIADPTVIPPGSETFFDEAVVRLPDCYQPGSARQVAPTAPTRAENGLPEQGFVFCAFNAPKKYSRGYFEIWMRLLHAVPGSVLWTLDGGSEATANLRATAAALGVDAGRLVVAPKLSLPNHMARHRHADLFLDSGPCGAHTTGADALYMGVPMITCPGRAFQSRVAASLLHAHGLPELVTNSLDEYEALALALARDLDRLATLKAKTLANKATHPLFDVPRYVRNFEAALEQMVERYRAGLPPQGFDVG